MRVTALTLLLVACFGLLPATLAADREGIMASGGGGASTDPPSSGVQSTLASPGTTPTLDNSGPVVVLLTATSERPDRTLPRMAIVRLGAEVLDLARLTPGSPAVLTVPSVEGLQLDVIGTDALGVPVSAGAVVRVVAP